MYISNSGLSACSMLCAFMSGLLPESLGILVTLIGVVINLVDFAVNIKGRLGCECLLALITGEKHPCS